MIGLDTNELSRHVITITALYVAYRLGLRSYFRQKDYELVRQRYLVEGADEVAANIEYGLSVYRANWAKGIQILRMFRDVGDKINQHMFDEGFIAYDQSNFQMIPHHRVDRLLGDITFWRVQQLLAAFVISSTANIKEDMCTELRMNLQCSDEKRNELLEKYNKLLVEKDKESQSFYIALAKIQDICQLIEGTRFTFQEIEQLKNRELVKEAVRVVKQKFPEQ